MAGPAGLSEKESLFTSRADRAPRTPRLPYSSVPSGAVWLRRDGALGAHRYQEVRLP